MTDSKPNSPFPSSSYRISHGLDFVLLSDDEVLVQFGTRSHPSELFRDSDMTGVLGRTVGRLLEGPATVGELIAAAGEEHAEDVMALVANLAGRGFLSAAEQDPVEQYLRYTFERTSELSPRSVTIFGCGPLGARIAEGLAQHGVGTLVLADDRRPDAIWNRCVSATSRGHEPQTTVAAATARALGDCGVRVDYVREPLGAVTVDDCVARTEFSVMAMEQVDLRLAHLVNRYAIRRRKPWLHAGIDGNFGVIGPLFEPPYTACYNDFRTLATAATPSVDMMNRYRRHILSRTASSFFPGLPAYAEIVAGYAVLAAVYRMLGRPSFASGRAVLINFEQMQIDVEDVLRLPRCPVCGVERAVSRPLTASEPAPVR